jgi:hypothetical protein
MTRRPLSAQRTVLPSGLNQVMHARRRVQEVDHAVQSIQPQQLGGGGTGLRAQAGASKP